MKRRILGIITVATAVTLLSAGIAQARTVVLLVHGGGWAGGNPETMNSLRDDLQARGVSAKTITYKVDSGHIPTELSNVRRTVRTEKRKGNRVVLYGLSAGAQLSAALAARGEADGAVIVCPPTDLPAWQPEFNGARSAFDWASFGMTDQEVYSMSPINRLTKKAAPTLILHGDADAVVPIEQGRDYYRKARDIQKDTKFITMPGVRHEYPSEYWPRATAWIKNRV